MIPTARLLIDFAFRVNAAMASGQYDSLTVDHVYAAAHREYLGDSLVNWLGADREPLSVIRQEDRTALNAMFARMDGPRRDARRPRHRSVGSTCGAGVCDGHAPQWPQRGRSRARHAGTTGLRIKRRRDIQEASEEEESRLRFCNWTCTPDSLRALR
jgi:hypothetical protein